MIKICNLILDAIFPKKCIHCSREGSFICQDCLSLIELNKIQYCNCFHFPQKGILCENCNHKISSVITIFNSRQALARKLYLKAQKIPELNLYISYLIITHLHNIVKLKIDSNTDIVSEKKLDGLKRTLIKFVKIKQGEKSLIYLLKQYPENFDESIIQKYKKVYIISLFRDLGAEEEKRRRK